MKRYLLFLVIVYLFMLVIAGCLKKPPGDSYIARVDDEFLTIEDLKEAIKDVPGTDRYIAERFVDDWIQEILIYREAVKKHLDRDEKIVADVEKYRKKRIVDTYLNYLFQQNITISNQEIRDYYEKNKESFKRDVDEARILQFIVDNKSSAGEIKRGLTSKRNKNRDKLINQYGGVYSTVRKNELIPELNDPIFSERALGVVGPIKTNFGYHIIEIAERFPRGSILSITDVRDEIIKRLSIIKTQTFYENYIDSLKKSVPFEINYAKLKDLDNER